MSVIEASMTIQQTKKQSDLEKRLKILRRQFYGKSPEKSDKSELRNISESENLKHRYSDILISSGTPSHSEISRSDVSYLHQDLLKILAFSSVAIGAQIILYFLINNHILNLNFF